MSSDGESQGDMEQGNNIIDQRDKFVPELDDREEYVTQDKPLSQDTTDPYIGAEVNMPVGDGYVRATVKKRKLDDDGKPVGRGNNNPLLDTRVTR